MLIISFFIFYFSIFIYFIPLFLLKKDGISKSFDEFELSTGAGIEFIFSPHALSTMLLTLFTVVSLFFSNPGKKSLQILIISARISVL